MVLLYFVLSSLYYGHYHFPNVIITLYEEVCGVCVKIGDLKPYSLRR